MDNLTVGGNDSSEEDKMEGKRLLVNVGLLDSVELGCNDCMIVGGDEKIVEGMLDSI